MTTKGFSGDRLSRQSSNIMSRGANKLAVLTFVFVSGVWIGSRHEKMQTKIQAPMINNSNKVKRLGTGTQYVDVHVGGMCRCGGKALPVPGPMSAVGHDTQIVQLPSKATGNHHKRFLFHPNEDCNCIEDAQFTDASTDPYLKQVGRPYFDSRCPNEQGNYAWEGMPDLGVEEQLPIFAGVLSYKAPLSLNGTLHNWLSHDLFRRIGAKDVFVQLNHRSEKDDEVMHEYQKAALNKPHPLTVMGSPEENLNPGLAIAKFCRAAEEHPDSHPNGENLLLFMEKDWNIYDARQSRLARGIEQLFRSANALAQRGVSYIHLHYIFRGVGMDASKTWMCPSQGVEWKCTTAQQQRWTNTPLILSCSWFLRYLEPFALIQDPIMNGCRPGMQENGYCDWEAAMQDGRIAWTNSQWVMANIHGPKGKLFFHKEIDK